MAAPLKPKRQITPMAPGGPPAAAKARTPQPPAAPEPRVVQEAVKVPVYEVDPLGKAKPVGADAAAPETFNLGPDASAETAPPSSGAAQEVKPPSKEAPAAPSYGISHAKPDTVVIYCSDPRFQGAFDEFIARELKLAKGTFVPIVIAGGGGVLARPHELPKEFKFVKERLELARDAFPTVRRAILINHEDCRYYDSLRSRIAGLVGPRLAAALTPREDLSGMVRIFTQLLAHLGFSVELYYARFADKEHTRVVFERIGG